MKAAILIPSTSVLELKEIERPALGNRDVIIKLLAGSINHHELWSLEEKSLKSESNIIMGSDGAGIIQEVGGEVLTLKPGDEVVINPSIYWGNNNRVQGDRYEILGFPTNGTFSEQIVIDQEYVFKKPEHLSFKEAAALPLAGLTAYRALFTRGELEVGNKVLITGIGGGAALFALLFAKATGASVYVTSSDENKLITAIKLGSEGGVNYKSSNWSKQLKDMAGGFDVIIDSAAGPGFAELCELANPGARISLFGRTAGKISNLNPSTIFWKQLSIHGTSMGTRIEFKKMLDLVSKHRIKPIIDSVFPAKDINEAFNKMKSGKQFGKIVIDMQRF